MTSIPIMISRKPAADKTLIPSCRLLQHDSCKLGLMRGKIYFYSTIFAVPQCEVGLELGNFVALSYI